MGVQQHKDLELGDEGIKHSSLLMDYSNQWSFSLYDNSPATFQRMMNALCDEELREGWAHYAYIAQHADAPTTTQSSMKNVPSHLT